MKPINTSTERREWIAHLFELAVECHDLLYPGCDKEFDALVDWIWSDCRNRWNATKEEILIEVSRLI